MNSYDDIKLEIVKSLNSQILNNAFKKLHENDMEIVPAHDYTPNVWENKWFNDEVIPGYLKGYCVWRNAYTNIDLFLSAYGDLVYSYAQGNDLLRDYLISSWTDLSAAYHSTPAVLEIWKQRYYNAISGYSREVSAHTWSQVLLPMFDYGPYSGPSSAKLEIYISKIDNNKDLLSSSSWTSIVLSSLAEYNNFIHQEVDLVFDEHVKNYHLDGQLTKSEINNVLLAANLSNFDYDEVLSVVLMRDHDAYINTDGFDYVVDYKRLASSYGNTSLDPHKPFYTYRWYRLWSSGFLEHGGIVKCPPVVSADYEVSNPANYIIEVDLTWGGDHKIVYNYDEVQGNPNGTTYERLYYGDKRGRRNEPIYLNVMSADKFLGDKHYFVRITPVVLLSSDVDLDTYSYSVLSDMTEHDYPVSPTLNKVSSYITTEVHHMKNSSFLFTRSDTGKLDASIAQYYLYYVTGFRKIIDADYDFSHATVTGIGASYPVSGHKPSMSIKVKNNLDETLVEGTSYTVLFYSDGGGAVDWTKAGIVNVLLKGIRPYIGILTFLFELTSV